MVRTYSLAKDGEKQLSPHFKVREFRCRDGSDKILIDDDLIKILEMIRERFGKPVTVTSGYRTATYNRACGGASKSQHLYGTAADIVISGVDPLKVCQYAETLMPKSGGIGWYVGSRFSHIDVRATRSRWKQLRSGQANITVSSFLPTLRKGMRNEDVKMLQEALNKYGYNLKVDGDFGPKTYDAVIDFQKTHGLMVDGVVGMNTWAALL